MTENKTNLGDFYCTVSSNGQIFIPVRMGKALGISPGDVVKFSVRGGKTLFERAAEESESEQKPDSKKDGGQERAEATA